MKVALAAALLLAIGCTSTVSSRPTVPPPVSAGGSSASSGGVGVPPRGAQPVEGGCGRTLLYKSGELPGWALVNAPTFLPYAVAAPGTAVGYLFSYPLVAGPAGNKILWYVGIPRDGHPLVGQGHPVGASSPVATFSKPPDSGPGEIFPSGVAVPAPGCWHFTLNWGGGQRQAEIDLAFE